MHPQKRFILNMRMHGVSYIYAFSGVLEVNIDQINYLTPPPFMVFGFLLIPNTVVLTATK